MFELFPDQPVYEYPQLINVLYCFAWSFVLSSIIAVTHRLTFTGEYYPKNFFQSLILGSIVTAMVMMAIGDSLARGFGIFGALAILRFRTNLISTRNISFIFASMAAGIACGVYSFLTAVIGTLAFCTIAFFLRLTPFSRKSNMLGELRFELPAASAQFEPAQAVIREFCRDFVLKRYRVLYTEEKGEYVEYQYELRLAKDMQGAQLAGKLRQISGLQGLRLNFSDTYVNLTD